MADRERATGISRDLFEDVPAGRQSDAVAPREVPFELRSARALCAQLHRKRGLPEKQRIAHLIFLNLASLLRHGASADSPGRSRPYR